MKSILVSPCRYLDQNDGEENEKTQCGEIVAVHSLTHWQGWVPQDVIIVENSGQLMRMNITDIPEPWQRVGGHYPTVVVHYLARHSWKKNIITITFLSCCICNHFCNDILPVYSYHCPCPACTGWQNQRSRCSFGRPQASLPPTEILILLAPQGGALRIGTYRDSHPSYHPLIAFEH